VKTDALTDAEKRAEAGSGDARRSGSAARNGAAERFNGEYKHLAATLVALEERVQGIPPPLTSRGAAGGRQKFGGPHPRGALFGFPATPSRSTGHLRQHHPGIQLTDAGGLV
jgi:hypothetical protein